MALGPRRDGSRPESTDRPGPAGKPGAGRARCRARSRSARVHSSRGPRQGQTRPARTWPCSTAPSARQSGRTRRPGSRTGDRGGPTCHVIPVVRVQAVELRTSGNLAELRADTAADRTAADVNARKQGMSSVAARRGMRQGKARRRRAGWRDPRPETDQDDLGLFAFVDGGWREARRRQAAPDVAQASAPWAMSVAFTAPADPAPVSFTASVMAVPVPPVVNRKPSTPSATKA